MGPRTSHAEATRLHIACVLLLSNLCVHPRSRNRPLLTLKGLTEDRMLGVCSL